MPSTYSNLKIELMNTGDNNTSWGNVTNVNLGTALEEAIVGSADVTFASNNQTLTLTDTNATQTARNLRLRCTGTTGGSTRDLIVPSIEKPYIVQNDCADSVRVKTSAGTGITVPAGKTTWVYCNATDVVNVVTYLTSLTFGGDLSVSGNSAVTGNSSVTGNATVSGTLAVTGNLSTSANLSVTSNASVSGNLAVTGGATFANVNDGAVVVANGTVAANTVGYRGLPASATTTTLALTDAGKFLAVSANVAIPANGTTAFPVGTAVVVYNNSASSISITITTDTLRLAGTASTGTRSVAQRGIASLLKVSSTVWVASGAGVS